MVPAALYTAEMSVAFRAAFASIAWHCDVVDDCINLASYLRFNPDLPRPQCGKPHADSSLAAFAALPLADDALLAGASVLFLSPGDSEQPIAQGKVVEVKRHVSDRQGALSVGMRLEAKDRLNPGMICLLSDARGGFSHEMWQAWPPLRGSMRAATCHPKF